ncbi:MAG: ATP-binding cassette domain-containing protein, partial [Promethearchaeota archaeon]
MEIQVRGASTNNLKDVSVDIGDGLTVVTGVSGSGKTSLVFDTLYHEARRRYLDVFSRGSSTARLPPAEVRSITGVGPSVAVGQNLLNRNPNSTLATASGLHPFLRLLFAHFGSRTCPTCDTPLNVLSEDAIVEHLVKESKRSAFEACAPIVRNAVGSHSTLLGLLGKQFGKEAILVDSIEWDGEKLNASETHHIDLKLDTAKKALKKSEARRIVDLAKSLGGGSLRIKREKSESIYSWNQACVECGHWLRPVESVEFKSKCPHCEGKGCGNCQHTGLTPETTRIKWQGLAFSEVLSLSVRDAHSLFKGADVTRETKRLHFEILRRLDSLMTVGLDYIQLNRPSPSLSRGESQRVRLAIALTSELEDILHILDEPTIGQHYQDTAALLPAFLRLKGSVVFVEHDKLAASFADRAIDIGPGAGEAGGEIVFEGTPGELWDSETHTGTYFSSRNRVHIPEKRDPPLEFLKIVGAKEHNLKSISVEIPIGRFTVITGISGSGKSTLVEHVLVPSLKEGKPVQCSKIVGPSLKPVFVDQSPIGKNPRSNPATYTKLSDTIRDLFASETSLTPSHFSFNRPEGACPSCKGMGAIEVKMRYIPSTWITCSECEGLRYSEEVLAAKVNFGGLQCNIAEIYEMSIAEVQRLLTADDRITKVKRKSAERMLEALVTIGLGYLKLGQTSPSLSGGEAERIKLSKYLGKNSLKGQLIILDEPSSGLHPKDLSGLLAVIDRLVQSGATIVVVEHNTDIIRAADWVVDLGPGAGPRGGEVVYAGPFKDLPKSKSPTAKALLEEEGVNPRTRPRARSVAATSISIKKASANNLREVSVDIPKGKITVVTGPSGSGKSSLVRDVLEAEAQGRFLETLSMYERQSVKEGPEAPVESVTGLGVAVSVTPQRSRYMLRTTVGTVTEISKHLAVLLSLVGVRTCLTCKSKMTRGQKWTCPSCGEEAPLAKARHFSSRTYSAACIHCHGVGSFQVPQPEKLIVNPDKPLCAGAMYSPGFFPKGYLCKPYNGGYYIVKAIGARHGFDPAKTPWNEMART